MREDVDEIIEEFAEAFDEIREELCDEGVRCFLLKRSENSDAFQSTEVENGYYSEWSDWREATVFSFATTEDDFADIFAAATHIGYGVPDADGEIEVFAFVEDQIDKVMPDGTSPFYKGYARKDAKERFKV